MLVYLNDSVKWAFILHQAVGLIKRKDELYVSNNHERTLVRLFHGKSAFPEVFSQCLTDSKRQAARSCISTREIVRLIQKLGKHTNITYIKRAPWVAAPKF